ncbi:MAG: DUF1211 domain-containing protein [Acidobacteriaceae bacterium]|nr:DUF1211 domain-containing protein [Acidobacteriaceae bacterium]
MKFSYNLVAGKSVEPLAALSDGIFAVAMTLLVLDLHVPAIQTVHNEYELGRTLLALGLKGGQNEQMPSFLFRQAHLNRHPR